MEYIDPPLDYSEKLLVSKEKCLNQALNSIQQIVNESGIVKKSFTDFLFRKKRTLNIFRDSPNKISMEYKINNSNEDEWFNFISIIHFTHLPRSNEIVLGAEILEIFIPKSFKGIGIGRSIVKAWENAFLSDFDKVLFGAYKTKPESRLFWNKMGYTPSIDGYNGMVKLIESKKEM